MECEVAYLFISFNYFGPAHKLRVENIVIKPIRHTFGRIQNIEEFIFQYVPITSMLKTIPYRFDARYTNQSALLH